MVISHNLAAMNSQRQYNITASNQKKSAEKLSSGYQINRAADDAAGLTISEKMRYQIRGLDRGGLNIQDGISLVQVADGALAEVQDMMHRVTELSVQAANGTNSLSDRQAIQAEINQIISEVDRIGDTTEFNNIPIFSYIESVTRGNDRALVTSPSAVKGHMSEIVQVGSKYQIQASLDFSDVNGDNLHLLNGQQFTFHCSANCAEAFTITFTTDGSPNTAENITGMVNHKYSVDVSGCHSGSEVIEKTMDYLSQDGVRPNGNTRNADGSFLVSHSNLLINDAAHNRLLIQGTGQYNTEEAAQNQINTQYASGGGANKSGQVDTESITSVIEADGVNIFKIHGSSNTHDTTFIQTHLMNSHIVGITNIDVTTEAGANMAIQSAGYGTNVISSQRSELGAYQNRLEHSYANNMNTSENTNAAESRIRDTDIAAEMVRYSTQNILANAGQAMMAQANQSLQGVMALLQ